MSRAGDPRDDAVGRLFSALDPVAVDARCGPSPDSVAFAEGANVIAGACCPTVIPNTATWVPEDRRSARCAELKLQLRTVKPSKVIRPATLGSFHTCYDVASDGTGSPNSILGVL